MKKNILFAICFLLCTGVFAQKSNKVKIHLNHTAIYVMDLQKSGDFYMNVLGLDSIAEPFKDGKHIWLQTGPNLQMHIIQGATVMKNYYKNQHTCFSVPSVMQFTKMLSKRNISFEDVAGNKNAITNRVDGVKQIWLQDPDGYWIEINDAKD